MLGEVPWKKTGPSKRTWELGAEEQRLLGNVHLPSNRIQPVQGRQEGEERRALPCGVTALARWPSPPSSPFRF